MASVHGFGDEHDHRKLRMIGDARDAPGLAVELDGIAEPRPFVRECAARDFDRAVALRLEAAEREGLVEGIVGHERLERPAFPADGLSAGSYDFSEGGELFIVKRHAPMALSKQPASVQTKRLAALWNLT